MEEENADLYSTARGGRRQCSLSEEDDLYVGLLICEGHSQRSATFLIFLSRGYFRSVNCRRELAAALVEKRPVIAMREEDSGKGGASAAALREECDHFCGAEHVGAAQVIFDEPPVTWVRMRHFQLEACLRRCCCDAEGEERIA